MPRDDLLSWPVSAAPAEAEGAAEDARTPAELRAELAALNAELRRLRSRLDYVEDENERLARQLNRHERTPTPVEVGDPAAAGPRAESHARGGRTLAGRSGARGARGGGWPPIAADTDQLDFTLEDQLTFDVPALLAHAPLGDDVGVLRNVLRLRAVPATMAQARAEGVPPDVLGRMVTACRRSNAAEIAAHPEDLLEEVDRKFERTTNIVKAAMARAKTDEDVQLLGDFLSHVHRLLLTGPLLRAALRAE